MNSKRSILPHFSYFVAGLSKFRIVPAICVLLLLVIASLLVVLNREHIIGHVRTFGIVTSVVAQRDDARGIESFAITAWKSQPNVYFELVLRFEASDGGVYPNLFQTDALDTGIRAELDDGRLGVIVGNAAVPGSLSSFVFPDKLVPGKVYDLRVTALDRGYVRASLSGIELSVTGRRANFSYRDFRIGTGFSGTRPYNGKILAVSLSEGVASSLTKGRTVFLLLMLLLAIPLILSLIAILMTFRPFLLASWRDQVDRRLLGILVAFATADVVSFAYGRILLPHFLAPARTDLPTRAPLFEASAPFTDFTEILTFPNYVSAVSWAAPPAEQLRIMIKKYVATTWPGLWESQLLFVVFCAVGLFVMAWALAELVKTCSRSKMHTPARVLLVIGITIATFPILFAIDRGNTALHNTAFVLLGAAFVLQSKWLPAAVVFDLAAISKITPIAFVLAFFPRRQWIWASVMIALAVVATMLAALILSRTVGYHYSLMFEGQAIYTEDYAISPKLGLGYSNSFFSLWRLLAICTEMSASGVSFGDAAFRSMPAIRALLPFYTIAMALVGLDLLVMSLRRQTSLRILLCLSAIYQVMAPHIIADYYLTFLLLPLIVFSSTPELRKDLVVLWVSIAILVPKTYLWLPNGLSALPFWISISVPINAALIVGLYFYIRLKHRTYRDEEVAPPLQHR
jgi:hypothetical protein